MAEQEQTTVTEPWDGYDDAPADELIDAAGRKRSAEKLQEAIDYERAHKDRVTVIDAFAERLGEVGDDDGQDGTDGPEASKGQPGEIGEGDAVTPAGAEDTSERKTTGQVAAQEDADRAQRQTETNEKAAKAATEGGVTPVAGQPVGPAFAAENRQDRVVLAGHQYRVGDDVEPDPSYVFDTQAALDAELVDHVAMASSAAGFYLEVDGHLFRFDRDLSLAIARFAQGASVALNY